VIHVLVQFLVCFVVPVVKRTTFKLNNTSESVHVADGGCCGDLSTEAVAADGGHGDLVLVHEPDNVIGDVIHVVGFVVVRAALVSVVEHPYVSDVADLVVGAAEETLEVFSWFKNFRKPNQSGQVILSAFEMSATQSDSCCVFLVGSLCKVAERHRCHTDPSV